MMMMRTRTRMATTSLLWLCAALIACRLELGLSSDSGQERVLAEAEVHRAAQALHEAQVRLRELQGELAPPHWAGPDPLPHGNYTKGCTQCGRMGTALWCTCGGQATALSLESCLHGANATVSERGGFLTCEWKRSPPPRVGNVTSADMPTAEMCRVLPDTTFVAPQFKEPEDPIASAVLLPDPGPNHLLGTWTGVTSDGNTLNDMYLIEAGAKPPAVHVTCVDSGPMASAKVCDSTRVLKASHPDGNGGVAYLWHLANGTSSSSSLSLNFDSGSQGQGQISQDGGATSIKWTDGSMWVRRAPDEAALCCARCRNTTGCKAWTVSTAGPRRLCQLASSTSTAYPSLNAYSGYALIDDAASWCDHVDDNNNNVVMMDRHVPPSIGCGSIVGKQAPAGANETDPKYFPRYWDGDGNGKAWFFFPCAAASTEEDTDGLAACDAAEHCDCSRDHNTPGSMICKGPTFDDALIKKYVHGKKWIVFIHGGEFAWNNNIGAGYAILSAEVARNAGMGVLAVDYRTSQNGQNPYPAAINDVLQAVGWLHEQGASSVSLYGDSSGATQVVQTLLLLAHRKNTGEGFAPNITSAVTFSAWLDLTGANPGWREHAYCTGHCLDMQSPNSGMNTAGWDSLKGMCAAVSYAGDLPISHPLLSPVHAGPELLQHFPPLLLIVGGTEILMAENLQLAQKAQAAGAPVACQVYEGMWHDFEEFSQGCGGRTPNEMGKLALANAGKFLSESPTLKLPTLADGAASPVAGGAYGVISFISNFTAYPPVTQAECNPGQGQQR